MQSNKFSFKVASYQIDDDSIMANIHALDTEADFIIKRADFEKWLTNGSGYLEFELGGNTVKETIAEYWDFARDVNNTDALAHIHSFLCERVDDVKNWMETEKVLDLYREKLVAKGIKVDYLDECDLRIALNTYRSGYAQSLLSPVKAA